MSFQLVKTVCQDIKCFPKKNYQEHLHFTFLSGPNVVFSNGEMWKRHSACVKAAFDREIPVDRFVALSHELFERIGAGGIYCFSDLVQVKNSVTLYYIPNLIFLTSGIPWMWWAQLSWATTSLRCKALKTLLSTTSIA